MWNPLKNRHTSCPAKQRSASLGACAPFSAALLGLVIMIGLPARLNSQAVTTSADEAAVSAAASVKQQSAVSDYIIGPEDVLAVNVWKEPEVSRTLPVRPDGKISLPLVGDMIATGLTAQQLQASITQQLQNYVSSPEVSVIVQEVKSEQVNVVGRVVKP